MQLPSTTTCKLDIVNRLLDNYIHKKLHLDLEAATFKLKLFKLRNLWNLTHGKHDSPMDKNRNKNQRIDIHSIYNPAVPIPIFCYLQKLIIKRDFF